MGSKVKYELDKETGLLKVDRILSSSVSIGLHSVINDELRLFIQPTMVSFLKPMVMIRIQ